MTKLQTELSWLLRSFSVTTDTVDKYFLEQAYEHSQTSPDPSTKNGAVLVRRELGIAFGVNRFPKGIAETKSRLHHRPTKYRLVVHAESSAILNAARNGNSTLNTTLYCQFYTCSDCAKAIIQAGIKRVVGHAQLMKLASGHTEWIESIRFGWEMLHEAGVECALYDGNLGITTRFNGKDIFV